MSDNTVTESLVMEVLKEIYDPEIPVNIVDLGLVYELKISADIVTVVMTLTNPNCPVAEIFVNTVKTNLEQQPNIKQAIIELVWEPAWSQDRMSEEAKFQLGLL